jgi:hypothetical protein
MSYDDNDVEHHREDLRSMPQNSHLLNDFYQFLEFTRARRAQQSFQPIYDEQQILSISNIKTNFQHKSSTSKRRRPLNDIGVSIRSVKQNFDNLVAFLQLPKFL